MKKWSWTLILIFLLLATEAFSKEWNRIIPCVSTRADVEEILGKDGFLSPDALGSYRYNKSRVYIDYMRKDKSAPEKDVVEKITVYPDKSEPLAKYIKKTSNFYENFRKIELDIKISHVWQAYYFNAAESFEIGVQKNYKGIEVITSFGYYGLDSDCSKRTTSSPESKGNNF